MALYPGRSVLLDVPRAFYSKSSFVTIVTVNRR